MQRRRAIWTYQPAGAVPYGGWWVTQMDQLTASRNDRREPAPVAPPGAPWSRAGLFVLALVGGAAIFVVGSPYFELTPWNDDPLYCGVVAAALGLLTLAARRRSAASLRTTSYALFVAAVAMFVMVVGPFNWLVTLDDESYRHAVQDKLAQFLAVVPVILVLTWAARRPLGWIYVQKGRVRRWMTFGLSVLAIGATIIVIAAVASGITFAAIMTAAPWILVFAALNAVMEELWFRGVSLRAYTVGMGGGLAVVATALVFGAAHVGATYVSAGQQLIFAALVAGLGILLALAMRWADSLWGAVLFHIALDLVVVFEFVESV